MKQIDKNVELSLITKYKFNRMLLIRSVRDALKEIRKNQKLSKASIAKSLGITTYRYNQYETLSLIPINQLERFLTMTNTSMMTFIETIEKYLNGLMQQKANIKANVPACFIEHNIPSLQEALEAEAELIWKKNTNLDIAILHQWIYESGVLYPFLLLVRNDFIEEHDLELMKKHSLFMVDLWFIIYYQLPHESISQHMNVPLFALEKELSQLKERKKKALMMAYIDLIQHQA